MEFNQVVIVGGQILQEGEFVKGKNLLIQRGRVVGMTSKRSPNGFKVIDAAGCRVIPGFIDLHLHCDLSSEALAKEGPEHLNQISITHACYGTTRFLATFCTASLETFKGYAALLKSTRGRMEGAQVLGCHLEGPFLNPQKAGAQPRAFIRAPSARILKELLSAFGKNLRLMTLAPELKGIYPIIKILKKNKIRMAMGHTDATYQEASQGIKAGIRYGTHLFNQMRGLGHREFGTVGALLFNDHVFAEIIVDGIHVQPFMVKLVVQVKELERVVLATDCFAPLRRGDAQKPPRLPNGTLAGSALSLRRAIMNLVKFAGLDWAQGIEAASLNPARALGIDREYGSLEPGKWADVVLVDKNFNVKMTMVGGKIVYSR